MLFYLTFFPIAAPQSDARNALELQRSLLCFILIQTKVLSSVSFAAGYAVFIAHCFEDSNSFNRAAFASI